MVNLFDILQTAQQGRGFSHLSREFGLTPAEMQRALAAILPAFSVGLNRSLYDPTAFGQVIDLMVSGRYAPFFDGAGGPDAARAGTDALLRFFGSPETTRRVAEQGAAAAGIGADIMQRMLPMVAATLVGGLVRHASLEGIGDLLGQWSQAFHRAHAATLTADRRRAAAAPAPHPGANPFDLWSSMLLSAPAGAAPTAPPPRPDDPVVTAIDAWGGIVTAMLGGPSAPPASRRPEPPAPAVPANPLQVLARMFEAGQEVQAQQMAQWRSLIGTVAGPAPRT